MANGKTKELAVVDSTEYAILSRSANIAELYEVNLGGQPISEFGLDHVGVPAGGGRSFVVPSIDGETEEREIVGIPIYMRRTRAYWSSAFAGGADPPDCSSVDFQRGQGAYGGGSELNPSGICADCPMSRFGSKIGPDGQPTKAPACQARFPIFIMRHDDVVPIVLTLPPTSTVVWQQFAQRLKQPFFEYEVKFGLELTSSGGGIDYARVVITRAGNLDADSIAAVRLVRDQMSSALDAAAAASAMTRQAE